jgi:hypothetical protein
MMGKLKTKLDGVEWICGGKIIEGSHHGGMVILLMEGKIPEDATEKCLKYLNLRVSLHDESGFYRATISMMKLVDAAFAQRLQALNLQIKKPGV